MTSLLAPALKDLLEGNWKDFLLRDPSAAVGEATFALFVVAIVVLPTYARTQRVTLPAIALVLFSGPLIPMLPGNLVGAAWNIMWLSLAVAIIGLVNFFRQ